MCSIPEQDSHRFMDMIEAAAAAKEVKSYKKFTAWAKQVKARPRPADPLAPPKKKQRRQGGKQQQEDSTMALVAQIRCESVGPGINAAGFTIHNKMNYVPCSLSYGCRGLAWHSLLETDKPPMRKPRRNKQQSAFGSMLSKLAAKYGGGESEENEPYNEPTDEEFEAAQQRMQARAKAPVGGGKAGSSKAGGSKAGSSKAGSKRGKK
jgi:hypothetical protein